MSLMNRYKALKSMVTSRSLEFDSFMHFIETETSYLTAPASTKYHLCKEHGLLEHSVNVAETMLKIKAQLAPDISDESCVIVSLLHDLGKFKMGKACIYIHKLSDINLDTLRKLMKATIDFLESKYGKQ